MNKMKETIREEIEKLLKKRKVLSSRGKE